jgi:hypothetical protein
MNKSSTLYNKLGQYTEINLNNGIKTTFGYYGVGGTYDTTGNYYGKLWEIKSVVGGNTRQDVRYTWDACGNVASRYDVKFVEHRLAYNCLYDSFCMPKEDISLRFGLPWVS